MFWINWILSKGSLNNILLNKETLLKICPNPGLNFKVFKKTISYSNKVQQTEKKNDIIKITDNNKIKTTQKQQERPQINLLLEQLKGWDKVITGSIHIKWHRIPSTFVNSQLISWNTPHLCSKRYVRGHITKLKFEKVTIYLLPTSGSFRKQRPRVKPFFQPQHVLHEIHCTSNDLCSFVKKAIWRAKFWSISFFFLLILAFTWDRKIYVLKNHFSTNRYYIKLGRFKNIFAMVYSVLRL